MRVFVTGASGFIGSAVVPELINAGHQVIGLARSEASAAKLAAAGADVLRGDLGDPDSLRSGAAKADAVIHLAYIHDFSQIQAAARADRQAVDIIGAELEGSNRPLVIASGVAGLKSTKVITEQDMPNSTAHPRVATAQATLDLAARGVRSSVIRLAPSVHGEGDPGFLSTLINIARQKGVSSYIEDGRNCWPAVHRLDAARLFRLAIEKAPAGSILHGVDDEGVPTREIAEVIGQQLNLPVTSISNQAATEHFGWMAMFFGLDAPTSSAQTRELLGWQPTQPGLIEDLKLGHYFK